jgi:hypothetical protein
MAVSILNLNSELNIRASRSSWSGGGNSAEGNEGRQAGFCKSAEHRAHSVCFCAGRELPPAIDETLDPLA